MVDNKNKKPEENDLESELPSKKKKKNPSFIDTIKDFTKPKTKIAAKKAPVTFNLGVAVILFLFYLSIMIVSRTFATFLLILPTLYILARYMKLEREQSAKHQTPN